MYIGLLEKFLAKSWTRSTQNFSNTGLINSPIIYAVLTLHSPGELSPDHHACMQVCRLTVYRSSL